MINLESPEIREALQVFAAPHLACEDLLHLRVSSRALRAWVDGLADDVWEAAAARCPYRPVGRRAPGRAGLFEAGLAQHVARTHLRQDKARATLSLHRTLDVDAQLQTISGITAGRLRRTDLTKAGWDRLYRSSSAEPFDHVSVSADGKAYVHAREDGRAHLVRAADRCVLASAAQAACRTVSWSSTSEHVALHFASTLEVFNVATGERVLQLHDVQGARWSPNGSHLAVRLLPRGTCVYRACGELCWQHASKGWDVTTTPWMGDSSAVLVADDGVFQRIRIDGSSTDLAARDWKGFCVPAPCGSRFAAVVRLNPDTLDFDRPCETGIYIGGVDMPGTQLAFFSLGMMHRTQSIRVTWSPQGNRIAASMGDELVLFDIETSRMHRLVDAFGGLGPVANPRLAFAPNGLFLAATAIERSALMTGPPGRMSFDARPAEAAVVIDAQGVRRWTRLRSNVAFELPGDHRRPLAWSEDGTRLLVGNELHFLSGPPPAHGRAPIDITGLAVSVALAVLGAGVGIFLCGNGGRPSAAGPAAVVTLLLGVTALGIAPPLLLGAAGMVRWRRGDDEARICRFGDI